MNPDKLFDYLEGNLPESEHAQLEKQVAADPQLQRELAIAREMHRRSRGSREVMLEGNDPDIPVPAKPLGRRLITAFAALVLVNVLVGIAFIIGKKDGTGEIRAREAATRQQLEASLQKTAETSLPLPTIGDEIHLSAVAGERERVAANVLALAKQCGGSAAKASSCRRRARMNSGVRSRPLRLRTIHRAPSRHPPPTSGRSSKCGLAMRLPPLPRDHQAR